MTDSAAPTVARVFDTDAPGFAPDHPHLATGPERDRVLAYLRAGAALLLSPGVLPDVVDPACGDVVPTHFRTDGTWIWTDTVTYYLEEHGLAPDPGLLRHILAADGAPPAPDAAVMARAMAAIMTPR